MLEGIIIAAVIVGGVGIFIGVFLGIAGDKFAVEIDAREEAVLQALPGNNCGGCGYPGCSGLAAAIVKGEAPITQCPVGGAPVAEVIGQIMGVSADAQERQVAFVMCGGTCDKSKINYQYHGISDCSMAAALPGQGPKACSYGCTGLGSCVKACQFDAIHIVDGISVVDNEECKACGQCIIACPKNLIELIPYSSVQVVQCSSKDKGKSVMQVCDVGCIACGLCEKNCEAKAITVVDNIAHIDQSKCTQCGVCVTKCPKKIIIEQN